MNPSNKILAREKRKKRIRKNISGTADRPRLTVFKSNQHIYAQVINDVDGVTIVSASTLSKDFIAPEGDKKAFASKVGEMVAMKCKQKEIETVIFDRNGYQYHGRIKVLAEAARQNGLKF